MRDKVAICREADIAVSLGGTLLEIAFEQGRVGLPRWLRELGIDHVEVSNGSLAIADEDKRALIAQLAEEFTVIAEVGSKARRTRWPRSGAARSRRPRGRRRAGDRRGARERDGRPVRRTGAVHAGLVEAILQRGRPETVIFEAPRRTQQAWLLQHVGP